jgi:CBS-domain-containing membrane protein
MYYLGCLHPPGGATAFFVVTSGADVHSLGFDFVWLVIMTNVACLLIVAIFYNALFHWRQYPIHLFHPREVKKGIPSAFNISPEDIKAALQKTNSFIDVTPDDLLTLFEQASEHAEKTRSARINEKKLKKLVSLEKIFKKK